MINFKLKKGVLLKSLVTFCIMAIMLGLAIFYRYILDRNEAKSRAQQEIEKEEKIFEEVETTECAYVKLYTIYGNHLNIKGYLKNEQQDIDKIKLVLVDLDFNSIEYELNIKEKEDKINFSMSDNINEGIDLEKIQEGKYFVFIQTISNSQDKEIKRLYNLKNNSDYTGNEYYTLTKNGMNNKIEIKFKEREDSKDEKKYEYMFLNVEASTLPSKVYDIVIDAGHGGKSPGAAYNGFVEKDITLEYALQLKQKLKEKGYKVKLTRDKDEYVESYGNTGRAVMPYRTKAKLVLSIHLNSSASENAEGGVEVYTPNHMNLTFAKSFADNIVKYTDGRYSVNSYAKALDGVYVRTYTQAEVDEAIEYAHELNYTPYENLSTDTPYLFMVRETGGIMTKAYIDGRNKEELNNPYRNSNIAAESYLLELGFINSKFDLNNLLQKKENYINAIVDSIINNYK